MNQHPLFMTFLLFSGLLLYIPLHTEAQTCSPLTGLSTTAVSPSGVTFSWNALGPGITYEYVVQANSNTAPAFGTGTVTSNVSVTYSYTNSLTPASRFYIFVRPTNCNAGSWTTTTATVCLSTLSTYTDLNHCEDPTLVYRSSGYELKTYDMVMDVSYSVTRVSTSTSAGSQIGQGSGGSLSLSFIPTTDMYTVTAQKTGCPVLTKDQYIVVPAPTTQTLTGGGLVCNGGGKPISMSSSETGVYYKLQKDGTDLIQVNGTGFPIEFGEQTAPGTYRVKAWKCGSSVVTFGNLQITDKLTLPFSEGFNTADASLLPDCWSQEQISGTGVITLESNTANPVTTPKEGSRFVFFNSHAYGAGSETRLVSPRISTAGITYPNISFYWYNENNPAYASLSLEGVQPQYSLNGTTWVDAGPLVTRHDASLPAGTGQWAQKMLALPAAAANQEAVYLGFKFHSAGGDNMALDQVSLFATTFPLPIKLDYFRGLKQTSGNVLSWKFYCENTAGPVQVSIQRSGDGRTFAPIHTFMLPQANCGQGSEYTDYHPLDGPNYYRVAFTETNGIVTYSNVILISYSGSTEFVLLSSTQVQGSLTINVITDQTVHINYNITDVLGRVVQEYKGVAKPGSGMQNLDCQRLARGMYRLSAYASNGATKVITFLKN